MSFEKITSNDYWFKKYPRKIAGVEFETSSLFFPIQVKGLKKDVLSTVYGNNLDQKINKAKALAAKMKKSLSNIQ